MIIMIKYYFHIIDRQFEEEYDFEAYFTDHFEADRFITENEHDGNIVLIRKPFYHEVCMRPEDIPQF